MDTATHLLIGLGLGAMAHLSPVVAENHALGLAVTIGTVIASEAPDLDFFYKIKGTAAYLKNHRRWTHSVPAWFLWPSLITYGLSLMFQELPWGLLWLWCFAAVLIHVATDTLNTFGAVALLPFSDKRVNYDVLQVFDPVLFISQLLGIILWWTGIAAPGPLFLFINAFVVIYIAFRCVLRRQAVQAAAGVTCGQTDARISIMPTFYATVWKVIVETAEGFRLGNTRFGRFEEELKLSASQLIREDIEHLVGQSDVCDTFYSIAERIYSEVEVNDGRMRLILTDLRFRYGYYFPFRAIFELDDNRRIVSERLCHKSDMRIQIGLGQTGFVSTP